MNSKPLDYSKLMLRLVKDFTWPSNYMFKFIIPFEANSLNSLKLLFDKSVKITHRESKTGKYISVTAIQLMNNPDEVVAIYQKAEKIKNIIAL